MIFRHRLAGFGAIKRGAEDGGGVPLRFVPQSFPTSKPVLPNLPPISTTRLTPRGPIIIDASPPKSAKGPSDGTPPRIIDVAPLPPPKPSAIDDTVRHAVDLTPTSMNNSTNTYDASTQDSAPATSGDFQTTADDLSSVPAVTNNGDVVVSDVPVTQLSVTGAWVIFGISMASILGFSAYIHHTFSKFK